MVQTRRQWRDWRDREFQDTPQNSQVSNSGNSDLEEACFECSQQSDDLASDNDNILTNGNDMYRPGDRCHRHRLPDNSEYGVSVTSYRRRKPH